MYRYRKVLTQSWAYYTVVNDIFYIMGLFYSTFSSCLCSQNLIYTVVTTTIRLRFDHQSINHQSINQPSTINHQSSIINQSIINHQPSIINHQSSINQSINQSIIHSLIHSFNQKFYSGLSGNRHCKDH